MVNRREFLGLSVGASAALVLPPQLLRALQQSQGQLIQRAIPSTGEMLPVVGLSFANHPTCSDQAALRNGGVSCGSGRNLFARVGSRPVPEWAAEFDATTWAQFFLKYVISHLAVTVARVGTSKASHMIDNIAGGIGRLPDEATRRRMATFIDALPPIVPA